MRSQVLYLPALALASLCGVVVVASPFVDAIDRAVVRPLTWLAAAFIAVLFARMLFDPRCHRGISEANRELQGDQPFRFRGPKLTDPQWGLFGSRTGPRPLMVVRASLGVEFLVALVLASRDRPEILLLAGAGFAISIMLTILHVGLSTPVEAG